jgi:hypothetical protein
MNTVNRNFYRNLFIKTGGFFATGSLTSNMYPGDFFQIRNGEMIVLGNIFQNGIVDAENIELRYGIKLNPAGWNFSDGVSKQYSGRGSGQGPIEGDFEFSKQIIAFSNAGSFIFKGNAPESVKILNWNDIAQQLIIKLTQTVYSFRELYLVTETVIPQNWALAISGSDNGELEIATDSENFGLTDIFGHTSTKTIQAKDIEYYHSETNRKPVFFKAKKLAPQQDKLEGFINNHITGRMNAGKWAAGFYEYDFHEDPVYLSAATENAQMCMMDMLAPNELNSNTALLYFRWKDAGLEDIEKLF